MFATTPYEPVTICYRNLCPQQREAERQAEMLFQGLLARAFDGDLTGFTQEPVRSGRVNVNS